MAPMVHGQVGSNPYNTRISNSSNTTEHPPGIPKEGYTEPHYKLDSQDRITFIKDQTYYKLVRDVFRSHGYDIDACQTFVEYDAIWSKLHHAIFEVNCARILNRPAHSLGQKYIQAMYRADWEEPDRLSALLTKCKQIRLKVVD